MHAFLITNAQTLLLLKADPGDLWSPGGLKIQRLGDCTLGEMNLLTKSAEDHSARRTIAK
ncbi:hypothetical protein SynMITS9220_01652 [Synechococcus sp. MIT S9220]|nr:hypothetical protein SynMITS9220_01652 [Synechococcus sp. MIT S9220]